MPSGPPGPAAALIARLEKITDVRRAEETRRVPHLSFPGGDARRRRHEPLPIQHQTGWPSRSLRCGRRHAVPVPRQS
jgi:hypothetical protein